MNYCFQAIFITYSIIGIYEIMDTLEAPKNDEAIPRHQFYATVAAKIGFTANGLKVIGAKLDTLAKDYSTIHDLIQANSTRNKTLITAAVVVWAIMSGAAGWYIQRSVASFDQFTNRVETIEKKTTAWETDSEKRRDLPERVEAIRRMVIETQRQFDELEARKK